MRQWRYHPCQCFSREARCHVENNRHIFNCPDCGKTVRGLRRFDPEDPQDVQDSLSEVVRRWNMGEETQANLDTAMQELVLRREACVADPTNELKQGFLREALKRVEGVTQRLFMLNNR